MLVRHSSLYVMGEAIEAGGMSCEPWELSAIVDRS
jgi:hypothetical protein